MPARYEGQGGGGILKYHAARVSSPADPVPKGMKNVHPLFVCISHFALDQARVTVTDRLGGWEAGCLARSEKRRRGNAFPATGILFVAFIANSAYIVAFIAFCCIYCRLLHLRNIAFGELVRLSHFALYYLNVGNLRLARWIYRLISRGTPVPCLAPPVTCGDHHPPLLPRTPRCPIRCQAESLTEHSHPRPVAAIDMRHLARILHRSS